MEVEGGMLPALGGEGRESKGRGGRRRGGEGEERENSHMEKTSTMD